MKIKIGNIIYDAEEEPIMIILSKADKKNIAEMPANYQRYISYPEGKPKRPDMDEWTEVPESELYQE